MSKRKLNTLILDAAEANSHDVSSAKAYLEENNVDFQSFLERGIKDLGIKGKSSTKLTKSQSFFRRLVLAARITEECHAEWAFGSVKFQKMVYLCEEVSNMNFCTNYSKQAAGPFDNRFMHSIKKGFEKQGWFSVQKEKGQYGKTTFTPLDKLDSYRQYYDRYFGQEKESIEYLIQIFKPWKTDDVELVATIYACWSEINVNQEVFSEGLIVERVYAWHSAKRKFHEDQILSSARWMQQEGIYPST